MYTDGKQGMNPSEGDDDMITSEVGQKVTHTIVYGAEWLKRNKINETRREHVSNGVIIEVGTEKNLGRSRVQWSKADGTPAGRTWMKTEKLARA